MSAIKRVFLVGNGSIGSFTALLVAKIAGALQWHLTLIDYDHVERHNLANQMFRELDVGIHKALALRTIIRSLSSLPRSQVLSAVEKVTRESLFRGVVVSMVDSMAARKEIFAACRYNAAVPLYVEARSGGDGAIVYALDPCNPDAVRRYEATLYSDEEALPAPCADEQTTPTLFAIAAAIGRILVRFANTLVPRDALTEIVIDMEDLPNTASKEYTSL